MQHILFSEMFTDKADQLLARDLLTELNTGQIRHSEYLMLTAEQDLVRAYRAKYGDKQ